MVWMRTHEALRGESSPSFNVENYLAKRDADPNLVMVEFGHGGIPVAYQQPEGFTGQRAYIGVEAWLRGHKTSGREHIARKFGEITAAQNIFYMSYEMSGYFREDHQFDGPTQRYYVGPFETTSLLPDGAADEVYASNVFCDPHIADHPDRTDALLAEFSRIMTPTGVAILHETITPDFVSFIDKERLESFGLEVLGLEMYKDSEHWEMLEARYNGNAEDFRRYVDHNSFYLFLGKK